MSALSIRMRIDALGRRYHARTIADADLVHDASLADAALHAWHDRYPRDPWLAPTAFHLEQLYQVVQSPDARADATAELHYIAANFGNTRYAHMSRLRLAQGFPSLVTESAISATPNPYQTQATASASPSPSATGSATAQPSGAPPAPSHAPSHAPTTAPSSTATTAASR